jgi:hypothetical protein
MLVSHLEEIIELRHRCEKVGVCVEEAEADVLQMARQRKLGEQMSIQ